MSKRKLVLSRSFIKSYKKFTDKKPSLKCAIEEALLQLEEDAFAPGLRMHNKW